jgi:hypothetical protein
MFVVRMRLDPEDSDVPFVWPIGPKNPTGCGDVVFQIGLKHFEAVFMGQGGDFMSLQAVMPGVVAQKAQHLDQLLEKPLVVAVQLPL